MWDLVCLTEVEYWLAKKHYGNYGLSIWPLQIFSNTTTGWMYICEITQNSLLLLEEQEFYIRRIIDNQGILSYIP